MASERSEDATKGPARGVLNHVDTADETSK